MKPEELWYPFWDLSQSDSHKEEHESLRCGFLLRVVLALTSSFLQRRARIIRDLRDQKPAPLRIWSLVSQISNLVHELSVAMLDILTKKMVEWFSKTITSLVALPSYHIHKRYPDRRLTLEASRVDSSLIWPSFNLARTNLLRCPALELARASGSKWCVKIDSVFHCITLS